MTTGGLGVGDGVGVACGRAEAVGGTIAIKRQTQTIMTPQRNTIGPPALVKAGVIRESIMACLQGANIVPSAPSIKIDKQNYVSKLLSSWQAPPSSTRHVSERMTH